MKKFFLVMLSLSIIFTTCYAVALPTNNNSKDIKTTIATDNLTLYMGSPLVIKGDKVTRLDSKDVAIVPQRVNGRTMIPLRAISEHFKAIVSYDAQSKVAIIKINGNTASFPINEKYYFLDGKKIVIDTAAYLNNNTTYVPLRVICENILGLKVDFYNNVICIGQSVSNIKNDKAFIDNAIMRIGQAYRPENMESLTKYFNSPPKYEGIFDSNESTGSMPDSGTAPTPTPPVAPVAPPTEGSSDASSSINKDFSNTNTQVEGVDEADIVKTDGTYIYIAGYNNVRILNKGLEQVFKIDLPDNSSISEMYIDKDRLILNGSRYESINIHNDVNTDIAPTPIAKSFSYMYRPSSNNFVFSYIYDTTDMKDVKLLKEYEIEGNLNESRKIGDIVYLISNKYVYENNILPVYMDSTINKERQNLSLDHVMCMPISSTGITTISTINIIDKDANVGIESVNSGSNTIYMSGKSLYITNNSYEDNENRTIITKFDIDGSTIAYKASGQVLGNILNQFSMNEYNDHFYIATTTWNNGNNLFILDNEMNTTGSLNNLAKGERIYSVRFMGDTAYIVTFKNMDPLFVIDMSDVTAPVVKGELKIPGFSNYLHPIGDGLLLGIGQDTQEIFAQNRDGSKSVIGTRQAGLKLSLFNVSDPENPIEKDVCYLGESGTYAEVLNNHKALMVNNEKNLFGFDVSLASKNKYESMAMLYEVNKDGIKEYGKLIGDNTHNNSGLNSRRLCFIGDNLYYLQGGKIVSYDINSLQEIKTVKLP